MEENLNPIPENIPENTQQPAAVPVAAPRFLARGPEFAFGGAILLLSVLMCNFVFFGGFHLAFGIIAAGAIGCSWLYLKKSGHRFGWYEKALLILSLVICGGFGRSNDAAMTFFMLLFLFVAVNLALCIAAGQNRRDPQGAMSLLDAPRAFYRMGFGNLGAAGRGVKEGVKRGGESTRRVGAVGTGLLVSIPILAIMILLLMDADAAFEGLMDLLPEFELREYLHSAFWGLGLAWILYSRGISLANSDRPPEAKHTTRGINALTVNTVLIMVCLVYVVYLFSQLAYFSGGLAGILPEEFTMAEYARRGFFEMSWLSTINLSLICLSIWLIREEKLPRLTKIAGTFIAAITLFFIITASAKMFLYIGSYGLTWSRVVTEVFMLWLALTTVLVAIRLFLPKFGYMKAVVLTAMVLGTLTFWVDVETLVANYNMNAYRSGKLETVDVAHLDRLGAAAVSHLVELTENEDPKIAQQARDILDRRNSYEVKDFRQWNYTRARADKLVAEYHAEQEAAIREELKEILGLDLSAGTVVRNWYNLLTWENGKRLVEYKFALKDREALVDQLKAAGWKKVPLDSAMMSILNRDTDLFKEFRDVYLTHSERPGYWYFLDLHPEAENPTDPGPLLTRESRRFVLAYFNSNYDCIYIFQVDTMTAEKG